MKCSSLFTGVFLVFFSIQGLAQTNAVITTVLDSISHWKNKNTVGVDLSENAFSNWNAGGESSISGLFKGSFGRIYIKDNVKWDNELLIRYGINKQDGLVVKKTDDSFKFNSTYGYRNDTLSNWYHSVENAKEFA